ncbi:hypothetical protein Patl1_18610 [Pistacia atlantica]|uniref:Uncharacterized protein n=1 Tax=Pistacia atlantica TaxID=434234 RepID=A0ACC1C175_9ROSI|nr:hypothetical protein Patl1_18610 [Pistacia atlantica]
MALLPRSTEIQPYVTPIHPSPSIYPFDLVPPLLDTYKFSSVLS